MRVKKALVSGLDCDYVLAPYHFLPGQNSANTVGAFSQGT